MKTNLKPLADETLSIQAEFPGGRAFEVTDFSLFMYGLVRGDKFVAAPEGPVVYQELVVYELEGLFRLGIAYPRRGGWLTRLSGLVTASRAEFDVDPARFADLIQWGRVVAVLDSAFRGPRKARPD